MYVKNKKEISIPKSEWYIVNFMFLVSGITCGFIVGYWVVDILNIR